MVLEDGTRCEGIVGKLSARLPFPHFLRYVGPVVEKVPFNVNLGIDEVMGRQGRRKQLTNMSIGWALRLLSGCSSLRRSQSSAYHLKREKKRLCQGI